MGHKLNIPVVWLAGGLPTHSSMQILCQQGDYDTISLIIIMHNMFAKFKIMRPDASHAIIIGGGVWDNW